MNTYEKTQDRLDMLNDLRDRLGKLFDRAERQRDALMDEFSPDCGWLYIWHRVTAHIDGDAVDAVVAMEQFLTLFEKATDQLDVVVCKLEMLTDNVDAN
jgi:hypothetical protein